ncbi:MAG: anhydro-N-acetylmuramic acid kinase [Formosimonas sp.]
MSLPSVYLGVMSGTSLDGVDVVAFDVQHKTVVAAHSVEFSPELRAATLLLQSPQTDELHHAQLVANQLADTYSAAINALHLEPSQIAAVGVHGQTVRHRPECGYTIQLNQPARIAEQTGLTVVSDFRARDIAAGGQGAPLVPAFHDDVWRSTTRNRVILNIGGFANISVLSLGQATFGYDTGPGNVLMDAWIGVHQGQNYDANGDWATSGRPHEGLLKAMLAEPYFSQQHPKSTGRDSFHLNWLNAHLAAWPAIAPVDVQATLLQLTARSIAAQITLADEVIVCGGGAYNRALLAALQELLPNSAIQTSDAHGIAPQHVEAAAFAWLAAQTMQHLSGNLPAVTGAQGARILGNVTLA